MQRDDEIRLRHMLDAAREAVIFAHGRSRCDLDEDRMLLHTLVRCIEIAGEAAVYVSEPVKNQLPAVPWRPLIAMRNRLVHAYFEINLDIVWQTVIEDLPILIAELEKALG